MKNLKRLGLSFTLIAVLSTAGLAGETPMPPCAPGETQSPPCNSQSVTDGSTAPGETSGPPASDAVDVIGIAEIALRSLLLF